MDVSVTISILWKTEWLKIVSWKQFELIVLESLNPWANSDITPQQTVIINLPNTIFADLLLSKADIIKVGYWA